MLLNGAIFGQCLEDVARTNSYEFMEIFNYSTEKYEKYTKSATTSVTITIQSEIRMIKFRDTKNNYSIDFAIQNCEMKDSILVYNCFDLKNKKECNLIFSATKMTYNMTVKYTGESIMYRLKSAK